MKVEHLPRHSTSFLLLLAATVVFLAQPVHAATSFGSVSLDTEATAVPGGVAGFMLYLVNSGSSDLHVRIEPEQNGWLILADPANAVLVPYDKASSGYRPIAIGSSYVKAMPVSITAALPQDAYGDYTITVRVSAWNDQEGIGTNQNRVFRFIVHVKSAIKLSGPPGAVVIQNASDQPGDSLAENQSGSVATENMVTGYLAEGAEDAGIQWYILAFVVVVVAASIFVFLR